MKFFTLTVKEPFLAFLEWNDPFRSVNTLSEQALQEKAELLPVLEKSDFKALVLTSGKPDCFSVGADLKELQNIKSKEETARVLDKAEEVFCRFEALSALKIAAIHGACLGAGLELALRCDILLASDSSETRLALPETRLGLLPALGGLNRLPRRAGLKIALQMVLSGKPLTAKEALKTGLADEAPPAALLERRALDLARQKIACQNTGKTFNPCFKNSKRRGGGLKRLKTVFQERFPGRNLLFYQARKKLLRKTGGFHGAPLQALELMKKSRAFLRVKDLSAQTKQSFLNSAFSPESQNLIRLFFLQSAAKKRISLPSGDAARREDRLIGVLGAGVMGADLACLLASRGFFVRLQDTCGKALSRALQKADIFLDEQRRQGRINQAERQSGRDRLSLTKDLSGFSKADFVIEALPENAALKKKVFKELTKVLPSRAVLASNTSSLNLEDLSRSLPFPERFVGMHFFNPAGKMPLTEIAGTSQTGDFAIQRAFHLAKKLGKTPVLLNKASQGLIVNRLLAAFLSEALCLLIEGCDIRRLDERFTQGFGFPQGPFQLMDQIGLDICLQALKSFSKTGLADFIPSGAESVLQSMGGGRKTGKGFYIYGRKTLKVSPQAARFKKSGFKISSEECVNRALFKMINEAIRLKREGAASADDIDLAMVLGAGFPPFRGGPLKYAADTGFFSTLKKTLEESAAIKT